MSRSAVSKRSFCLTQNLAQPLTDQTLHDEQKLQLVKLIRRAIDEASVEYRVYHEKVTMKQNSAVFFVHHVLLLKVESRMPINKRL
ncbi:MAG: hypothetical protein RLZZ419_1434 [Pseudomonadota bacterium]|jgi:hypothetical protein